MSAEVVARTRTPQGLVAEFEQLAPMPLQGALQCAPGELLALVGPSGAGKTSLMRVLAGLMRPQQGHIRVAGQLWCDTAAGVFVPPQQRHVGLVFQNYALMPHLDAVGNVALSLLHLPADERRRQARHWLDHVGLSAEQQTRRPAALSGGQQQRVAVARALAREPHLLLLDEPFSAVDQMMRQGLYRLLADLRRELSVPIVLVTHDLNEARLLADTLVVMDGGRVLQQGTPAQIYRSPRNARVADLVGMQNRFQGQWQGAADEPGWGWLAWLPTPDADPAGPALRLKVRDKGRLAVGQRVTWVVQGDGLQCRPWPVPDEVGIHTEAQAAPDGGTTLQAHLTEWRHLGEMSLAVVSLDALPGVQLQLTLGGRWRQGLAPGQRLAVEIDCDWVHVMPQRLAAA